MVDTIVEGRRRIVSLVDQESRPVDVVLVAGVRRLAVDAIVNLGPSVPGTVVTTAADTPVGVGLTVPLPVAPAGSNNMTVQNTSGSAGTRIRVRELGGTPGAGVVLPRFSVRTFEVTVAALEVEHVAGPAGAAMIQFEG